MEFDLATIKLPSMARFGIVAFLVLLVPYLTRRARLPAIVGYLLGGVLIGPHALGVFPQHNEVSAFFAELGKLLLMFFVGLEVDLRLFVAQRTKSLLFGLATFSLPMLAGTLVGLAFGYGVVSAILVGSLLASHTLIAYPLVMAAGLSNRPAVTITVGATILTDMMSLFVLAICLTTHKSGFAPGTLVIQVGELILFIAVMIYVVGPVGRWAFNRLGRSDEACFTLMMAIVALGSTFAEALQLDGILGAFLAGLAVNEAVRGTPAKEKIEFLGNIFFIPAFFVVTGFLIDLNVFWATIISTPGLVLTIVLGLISAKWLASELVGRQWRMPANDRGLMASLTLPQVAATLAAALVGYQAINKAGERLLDAAMLNTVLVLVIVTSVLGPVLTEHFIRKLTGTRSPVISRSVLGRSETAAD
jgi:Kef-type K+ transport system membrane component KefB